MFAGIFVLRKWLAIIFNKCKHISTAGKRIRFDTAQFACGNLIQGYGSFNCAFSVRSMGPTALMPTQQHESSQIHLGNGEMPLQINPSLLIIYLIKYKKTHQSNGQTLIGYLRRIPESILGSHSLHQQLFQSEQYL